MKNLFFIAAIVTFGLIACDTPSPATTEPTADSTSTNSTTTDTTKTDSTRIR